MLIGDMAEVKRLGSFFGWDILLTSISTSSYYFLSANVQVVKKFYFNNRISISYGGPG